MVDETETMKNPPDSSAIAQPVGIHESVLGAMLLFILLLSVISSAFQGQNVWSGWPESAELRHPAYAERVHVEDVFRTHANTWSNLAYVLVGLYAIAFGWRDRRRKCTADGSCLAHTPQLSLLFGVACCYLGVGSGLFHASLTRWGQQLDVAAMYSPLLVLIAINAGRWLPAVKWSERGRVFPTWPALAGLVLIASFLLHRYKWSMRSGVVLPGLILAVAAFALLDQFQQRRRMAVRWLALSLVALVAAVTCRQLDVAHRFSGPDAWLQGHALWHILTSLSLACMYLYYRSEMTPRPAYTNC
jgi:hypothetical protein